jgi:anti-sigma regulatory factor (Ser/Thr protein kinase)
VQDIAQPASEFESSAVAAARLPGEAAAVARALALARAFAGQAGLCAEAADKLAIVVEEWVVNVVEHGELPAGTRIALRLEHRMGLVRLAVSDAGRPFDPRAAVFEGPNLERGGGAGLELIRAWCRIAAYARRRGRNRLVLEMPLP